jgi:hypothetical protein
MARSFKDSVTESQVVLAQLRRTSFVYRDQTIGCNRVISDALFLWDLCIKDLLNSHGSTSLHRVDSVIIALSKMDIAELAAHLKTLDLLLIQCGSGVDMSFDECAFKQHTAELPPEVRALCGLTRELRRLPLEEAFRDLRTIFCFITRINLTLDCLRDDSVEKFFATEERIKWSFPDPSIGHILQKWFPRQVRYALFESFDPKHGPGAVSDGCKSIADKYRSLCEDTRVRYLLNRVPGNWSFPPGKPKPSRAIFVPKSLTTYRTICSEPSIHQWLQQGFLSSIIGYINKHPYLRRRIDLAHPCLNQVPAWIGSVDGSFSTIDLSDASDSVTHGMVKTWFRSTALREILLLSRSSDIEIEGTLLRTSKFAPMGSALCFPVECLVFAAIVETAIMRSGGVPRDSQYRVYGDDIVVETQYAQSVVDVLQENGFVVNTSKSFIDPDSRFRESCGGDFLHGIDVYPIRLSRRFCGLDVSSRTPSSILSLVDLANTVNCDLPRVRLAVIDVLNRLPAKLRVAFSGDGSYGLYSPQPTNYHLERRPNLSLQCVDVLCGTLSQSTVRLDSDEEFRLLETLRATRERRRLTWPEDRVSVEVSPPGRLRWSSSRRHAYPDDRGGVAF